MNKVRVEKVESIVRTMAKEEVTRTINDLEALLITQNIMIEYNLVDNDIDLYNYICKSNAISDILQDFRLVAHEQGKLERKMYA